MATIDSKIDDLYHGPLGDFVASRTALAKTLTGDDAKRVRALTKPTVVPWAVNQVYWRSRPVYDRLIKAGEKLRDAQVAALGGKKADVRAATDAHRKAVAEAVQHAEKYAAFDGAHPPSEALMRTFEAISLKAGADHVPGRLTKPLQPAGFEALAGVTVAPAVVQKVEGKRKKDKEQEKAKAIEAREKAEALWKKHEDEVREAEAALERARRKMAEAEAALKAKKATRQE